MLVPAPTALHRFHPDVCVGSTGPELCCQQSGCCCRACSAPPAPCRPTARGGPAFSFSAPGAPVNVGSRISNALWWGTAGLLGLLLQVVTTPPRMNCCHASLSSGLVSGSHVTSKPEGACGRVRGSGGGSTNAGLHPRGFTLPVVGSLCALAHTVTGQGGIWAPHRQGTGASPEMALQDRSVGAGIARTMLGQGLGIGAAVVVCGGVNVALLVKMILG